MARHLLYYEDYKTVRNTLNEAIEIADKMLALEKELVERLLVIDKKRFYVLYGCNCLRTFCVRGLRLSATQAQRVVTRVRRA